MEWKLPQQWEMASSFPHGNRRKGVVYLILDELESERFLTKRQSSHNSNSEKTTVCWSFLFFKPSDLEFWWCSNSLVEFSNTTCNSTLCMLVYGVVNWIKNNNFTYCCYNRHVGCSNPMVSQIMKINICALFWIAALNQWVWLIDCNKVHFNPIIMSSLSSELLRLPNWIFYPQGWPPGDLPTCHYVV